jgi:hypothetical protein
MLLGTMSGVSDSVLSGEAKYVLKNLLECFFDMPTSSG